MADIASQARFVDSPVVRHRPVGKRQDAKFMEMLVYIASKCENHDCFGAVKLNKILYYADLEHMARQGRSISGQTYQKLEHGPAPRSLVAIRDRMKNEDAIAMQKRRVFTHEEHRMVALREADLEKFTASEIASIDHVIERFRESNGNEVSEMSHGTTGWRIVNMGENVVLETVFVGLRDLTSSERAHALTLRLAEVA